MADPKTCWHRVILTRATYSEEVVYACASCYTEITDDFWSGRQYKYDPNHENWVQVGQGHNQDPPKYLEYDEPVYKQYGGVKYKIIITDTWIDIDAGAGAGYLPVLLRLDDRKQFILEKDSLSG